jgi:glutaredoxin
MKKRFPDSFYNPITFAGAIIASVSFGLILFLTVLDATSAEENPYLGIITFIIFPSILVVGLGLIAFGIYKAHKQKLKGTFTASKFPVLDLNDPRHRISFTFFSVGTILFLVFTAFGSFKAYEYTETVEFCGTVCHNVMNPEYTAYKNSPHSRVACVQCHIGSGTTWYVKSKISGAYQVYSVLFHKYSKPIPTPVENLRPAQGTCEQCHWPKNFFSEKKVDFHYYLSDKENTSSSLTMLLKIGGGNSEMGTSAGIHWHMNIDNTIMYYPSDKSRQDIPWVKITSKETGKSVVYKTEDFDTKKLDNNELRKMDCIDCHNRPSHIYNPPDKMVNRYMSLDRIDPKLPYIKSVAVDVLDKPYSAKPIALDSIKLGIQNFYESNYPQLVKTKSAEIGQSIKYIQDIYKNNYFPSMNVSWKGFPNNIGHTYAPGCFRCHDGKHYSEDGKMISNNCNICHTIIEQKTDNGKELVSLKGLEFQHPVDLGNSLKEESCVDCHSAKKSDNL